MVDAHYRFLYVNIGAQGSANDAAVYNASSFSKDLLASNNPLNVPESRCIPGSSLVTPFVLVGDEAYPLRPHLMKPFSCRGLDASERIFNYRLSRARRVVENAFGILANRFRILLTTIQMSPTSVEKVVMALCALHNFLRSKSVDSYEADAYDHDCQHNISLCINYINHVSRTSGSNYNSASKNIRDILATYFVNEGQVHWQ